MSLRDSAAVECARIARAFHLILDAAIAQLLLHYGARLSSLALCAPRAGRAAMIAALYSERDAALLRLRHSIRAQRNEAMERVRAKAKRRFRCAEISRAFAAANRFPQLPNRRPRRKLRASGARPSLG